MERFITLENIKRFKGQLAVCADPEKRSTLEKLLAAEEAHLKKLNCTAEAQNLGKKPEKARLWESPVWVDS